MSFAKLKILFLLIFYFALCVPLLAQRANYCDSLTREANKAIHDKDYTRSLELLSNARIVAEKNRWHQELFCVLNSMAQCYYYMLDYGESLNFSLEAYSLAVKELDVRQESMMLSNIALLYSKQKEYDRSITYFKKAYDIAKESKNYKAMALNAMNMGFIFNRQKKPAEANTYFKESLTYAKEDPNLAMGIQVGIAESDLLLGNAARARAKAMALYDKAKELNYNDLHLILQEIISKSYLQDKKYDMAAVYANKVLAASPDDEGKRQIFDLLTDIYNKQGDLKKALSYKDSIITVDARLNDSRSGRLYENSRVKFEMANYKNEITIKDERIAADRKIFYSLAVVFLAVVTIIVLMLRQKKSTAQLKLEKRENENLMLEKQMLQKEIEAQAEQEHLRSEIEARNRELSAKALYLSGRNELIEGLIATISQSTKLSKDQEVASHVSTLKSYLKSDHEWDSFISHFEEVNPGFINRLKEKHPELTLNDVRFIIYLYMNLSIKEIASMFNITPESCRKRKERIAAKMDLPEKTRLYSYISTI
jgi:tetratricopeptide (TPR) repeat protein